MKEVEVPNLTAQTVIGFKWTYSVTFASVLLQLLYTAAISRLLAPELFGLIALGGLLVRFGSYFAHLGIGSALIQRAEITDEDARCAFTSSVALGLAFFGLFWIIAPAGQMLLDEPDVIPVARALASAFIISGLGATSIALLRRGLRFQTLAFLELASFALGYLVVGLSLAATGFGVWSLVCAPLVSAGVQSLFGYLLVRHPIRPLLDRQRLRHLYSFGGMVSVIGFLEFLSGSIDTLAVGAVYGASKLGQYSRAMLLVSLPVERITAGLIKVLFPAASRIQDDRERTAEAYVAGLALSSALILPACAALAANARSLVAVVLGEQWDLVAGLLPLVALSVAFDLMCVVPGVLCEARARLAPKLALQFIHLVTICSLITSVVLLGGDVYWLAASWAFGQAMRWTMYLWLMQRDLRPDAHRVRKALLEAVGLALIPGAIMRSIVGLMHAAPFIELAIAAGAGFAAFLLLMFLFKESEVRRQIRERRLVPLLFGSRFAGRKT